MNQRVIDRAADNIRILSIAMVEKAKSGHPGGAMGGADFMNILYSEFLNYDPSDLNWANRDRFFLDPGHMSPMLYSTLALAGIFTMDELKSFRQWGSITSGHPERDIEKGIENTSGPLGQGHAMALVQLLLNVSLLHVSVNGSPTKPMLISLMAAFRKKSLRVWDVWLGILACTISLCSMIPMTYSFPVRPLMFPVKIPP